MKKSGASSPFTSTHQPQSFTLSFAGGRRSSREAEPTIGGVNSIPSSPNDGPIIRLAPPSEHGTNSAGGSAQQHQTGTGMSKGKGPGSIPNFPAPNEMREPVRSPSPTSSYASSSQFKAPALPKAKAPGAGGRPSLGKLPSMAKSSFSSISSGGGGGSVSPWHALAAASGAPTPSLDGPGRNSPMLGGPFEQLNLEGSWSGANLFGHPEGAVQAQNQGAGGAAPSSLRPASLPVTSPLSNQAPTRRTSETVRAGGAGMTAEMLEKYRALAGRASATGSAGRHMGAAEGAGGGGTSVAGSGGSGDVDMDQPGPGYAASATSSRSTTSGGSGGMKLTLPPALAVRRGSIPAGNSGLAPPTTRSSASHGAKQSSPLGSAAPSASMSPGSASASMAASGSGSDSGQGALSGASGGSGQGDGPASGGSGFLKMLVPNDAPPVLFATDTLVLDVRPPSAFEASHIYSAHSVPVPSTLLRRPAFSVSKMAAMLSPSGQEAVNQWQSMKNIVLIDVDSLSAGDGSILGGLAGKFEREGFKGTVWFIRGGQVALAGVPAVKGKMIGEEQEQGGLDVPGRGTNSTSPGPMSFSLGGMFLLFTPFLARDTCALFQCALTRQARPLPAEHRLSGRARGHPWLQRRASICAPIPLTSLAKVPPLNVHCLFADSTFPMPRPKSLARPLHPQPNRATLLRARVLAPVQALADRLTEKGGARKLPTRSLTIFGRI